jgi:hypothetical protein
MLSRDDIIEAASKAGFETKRDMIWVDQWEITPTLTRFATLVAAAEREACARLVEPSDEHRRDASWAYLGGEEGVEMLDGIAAAIRARGQA